LAQVLPRYVIAAGADDYALTIAPHGGSPFSLVIKDGSPEIEAAAVDSADALTGSPAALVLLFYGRIGLAEAQQDGVVVTGNLDRVRNLLNRLEKP
jgi:hypothetical protein